MGELIKQEIYRQYPALNYSKLSAFSKNPKSLIELEDISDNDSIKMGSYVDNLLFSPYKNNEEFIIGDIERPSGQMGDFVDALFKYKDLEFPYDYTKYGIIDLAYKDAGFKRDSKEKVTNRFKKEGYEYYKFLVQSEKKRILTKEQKTQCEKAVLTLKTHEWTSGVFNPVKYCEVRTQLPLVFEYEDFQYKILIDSLYINHRDKIISPKDIKTTSDSIYSFPKSVFNYRYDIQSSLYTKGVQLCLDILECKDYTIEPLEFIVYSFKNKKVLKYNSEQINTGGEFGFYDKDGRIKYKGWRQLSQEIKWHMENGLFEYPKEVYESRGSITIQPPI